MLPTRILRSSNAAVKSVLYHDKHLLVLNKPPGLVCQLGFHGDHVKSSDRLDKFLWKIEEDLKLPSALLHLHRLDAGTTGCLAVATTETAARSLSKQFVTGDVQKTYLALVRGGKETFPTSSGRIESPILYEDGFFKGLGKNGKPSVTEWEVVGSSPTAPLSLLRLNLLTGNKHQLRIHTAMVLGAPILGDTRYSKKPVSPDIASKAAIPPDRTFLHASEISFFRYRQRGPQKRLRLGIRSPLPRDFAKLCKIFKIPLPEDSSPGILINNELTAETTIPELEGRWLNGTIPSSDIDTSN
ncbi:pseudouridine synthase [Coprinopsis marcescibilis]|uniref:21S rRNA pseudouridine(2819) synthase n=1 Tax=Coprinopsis marcescibilis TaxID=230819 RepID=A0A5C3LFK5_COPMA|nr:pseudouridine synthase [Coprinopsis marcescibilis]